MREDIGGNRLTGNFKSVSHGKQSFRLTARNARRRSPKRLQCCAPGASLGSNENDFLVWWIFHDAYFQINFSKLLKSAPRIPR